MPIWLQLFIAFFYGSVLGSFIGVILTRIPAMRRRDLVSVLKGISYPPSACPCCQHSIRWFENIPVVSYLALRGRCSSCKARIPPDHLVMEIVAGVAACAVWLNFV